AIRPCMGHKLLYRARPGSSEVARIEWRSCRALGDLPRRLHESWVGSPVVPRGGLVVDQRPAVVMFVPGADGYRARSSDRRPETVARGHAFRPSAVPQRIHNMSSVGEGRLMYEGEDVCGAGLLRVFQVFFQPVKLSRQQSSEGIAGVLCGMAGVPVVRVELN